MTRELRDEPVWHRGWPRLRCLFLSAGEQTLHVWGTNSSRLKNKLFTTEAQTLHNWMLHRMRAVHALPTATRWCLLLRRRKTAVSSGFSAAPQVVSALPLLYVVPPYRGELRIRGGGSSPPAPRSKRGGHHQHGSTPRVPHQAQAPF